MSVGEGEDILELHGQIIGCTKCPLSKTRTHAVPGEGCFTVPLMFIGEGPGRDEDLQGRPFVGRAGKLLDELLVGIEVNRSEIFITNIMKCRPSEVGKDRRPTEFEVDACTPYLERQIKLVKPKVICTLGDTATRYILNRYGLRTAPLSFLHGKPFKVGDRIVFPTYHPAAALYNPQLKSVLLGDFKGLKNVLEKSCGGESQTLDEFFR